MHEAALVYPHQLFKQSPAIKKGRKIFIVEEHLILSYNPTHNQKLIFHKLSLDAYEDSLRKEGHDVERLSISSFPTSSDVFDYLKKKGIRQIHVVDTVDFYLEQEIARSGIQRINYESPMFMLSKPEATERYKESKKYMASFYKKLRIDKGILVNDDGSPFGGKWSFDSDNRKKLDKKALLPNDMALENTYDVEEMSKWLETVKAEKYGSLGCWLPYTHEDAEVFLKEFLKCRFEYFGDFEDALTTKSARLFHSSLSPLLNVGLLEPDYVVKTSLAYAHKHKIPINSLEGFIRQIIGWREFIRAAYETDHIKMRNGNFWNHKRALKKEFWTGETGMLPVDDAITKALKFGYNHHIERLMILGNFMLLNQTNPHDVYRWFMSMYIDAYDWVMVPNVYGMSQFSDGGIFATKPYISGSSYIMKMSDYSRGKWEEEWTALYWNFIHTHQVFFSANYRLSMMPRMLKAMSKEKRDKYLGYAKRYLT